jgi:FlaA1/EpsC-like NDP-sugar epimerase
LTNCMSPPIRAKGNGLGRGLRRRGKATTDVHALENKRILVTGSCGTIGSELVRQLLTETSHRPSEVVGIDNNESGLFFQAQAYSAVSRARFFLADIRDRDKLVHASRGIDIVFHAAALKHVELCERSPMEAVQTNVFGVQNLIQAAEFNGVEKVIFMSTDKAVNPTNVMGTSKLMGERLLTAANCNRRGAGPILSSTRFGNVLGSRGSVIQVFRDQIANGGPVTLTDRRMTRFIMSIAHSVKLAINSSELSRGGEVIVTKMPAIRISDLADVMVDTIAPRFGRQPSAIRIEEIGAKPGEKLFEELISGEEIGRALELDDYFVVLPAFKSLYRHITYEYPGIRSSKIESAYNSAQVSPLGKSELKVFLTKTGLLD